MLSVNRALTSLNGRIEFDLLGGEDLRDLPNCVTKRSKSKLNQCNVLGLDDYPKVRHPTIIMKQLAKKS